MPTTYIGIRCLSPPINNEITYRVQEFSRLNVSHVSDFHMCGRTICLVYHVACSVTVLLACNVHAVRNVGE